MPWQISLVIGFLGLGIAGNLVSLVSSGGGAGGIGGLILKVVIIVMIVRQRRDGIGLGRFLLGLGVLVNIGLVGALLAGVLPVPEELLTAAVVEALGGAVLSILAIALLSTEAAKAPLLHRALKGSALHRGTPGSPATLLLRPAHGAPAPPAADVYVEGAPNAGPPMKKLVVYYAPSCAFSAGTVSFLLLRGADAELTTSTSTPTSGSASTPGSAIESSRRRRSRSRGRSSLRRRSRS